MPSDGNTWDPPVIFRFQVEFQKNGNKASASFAEVDALEQELVFSSGGETGSELPSGVRMRNITLKRALEPLNEQITVWIKNTFRFRFTGKVEPRNMTVSLLDAQNKVVASWICERALPVKWSVSPLNASDSRIAIETITLQCEDIRRNR